MTLEDILKELVDLTNLARSTSEALGQGIKIEETYKLPHGLDLPIEKITLNVSIGFKDGVKTFVNFGVFDLKDFDEYKLSKSLTRQQFLALDKLIKDIMSKVLTESELKTTTFLGDENGTDNYSTLSDVDVNIKETIH